MDRWDHRAIREIDINKLCATPAFFHSGLVLFPVRRPQVPPGEQNGFTEDGKKTRSAAGDSKRSRWLNISIVFLTLSQALFYFSVLLPPKKLYILVVLWNISFQKNPNKQLKIKWRRQSPYLEWLQVALSLTPWANAKRECITTEPQRKMRLIQELKMCS